MFVGTFDRTIDANGRLALPARFRARLSEGGYVTSLETCLGLWTPEGFQEMVDRLEGLATEGRMTQQALRTFYGGATEVVPDTQNRITLPAKLRQDTGLGREIKMVGRNTRVELWDPPGWATVEDPTSVAEVFEALAL